MPPLDISLSGYASVVCEWIFTILTVILAIVTFPVSLLFCLTSIPQYERVVTFRFGRVSEAGPKGPGLSCILPCIEDHTKVDMRTMTHLVPSQEVLTKNAVTLQVDAVVYYRVVDANTYVVHVKDAFYCTQLLAETTIRSMLGTRDMTEIIEERLEIAKQMEDRMNTFTEGWGIKVEKVEIKDVRLPEQLQKAMAAEAEAIQEAKANVIIADGELKSSVALKEAAEIIDKCPTALQLRYLQTLRDISSEKSSTIIFPMPIDFCSQFSDPGLPDKS